MKIEKNQIDELNAELTLVIEKEDYLPDFKKQLQSYRDKAQIKGFRKGKTPISVIKKMYGPAIIQESVSKILTDQINNIIESDDYNIIGEPYLIDRENLPVIDHKTPEDYSYKFELGLEPEFSLAGISESDTYTKYKVDISKEMIDDEVESLLKRVGEQKSIKGPATDNDIVYFIGKELEGDNIKPGGHISEFSSGLDRINESYASQLEKLEVGASLDVDVYQLEKDLKAEQVEKYLLKVEEDQDLTSMGSDFRLEIKDIVRLVKGEMNQETFDKAFGKDEVTTEEAARDKIKEFLEGHFDTEANNLLNREIMENLMTVNSIQLPEGFLKKWLTEKSEEAFTDEQFEGFKKEMKWRIIKKKMVKKYEVDVQEQEILQYFINAIRNYSPYIDEESLKTTAFSLMKNREQLNKAVETISSEKVFTKVREDVKTEETATSKEGFYDLVKEINEKAS